MRKMIFSFLAFAGTVFSAMSGNTWNFDVEANTDQIQPYQREFARGETWNIAPRVLDDGVPRAWSSNTTFTFFWQKPNMLTNWWASTNGTFPVYNGSAISTGRASMVWNGATMDIGANQYNWFIRGVDGVGISYRVSGTISMNGSPGAGVTFAGDPVSWTFASTSFVNSAVAAEAAIRSNADVALNLRVDNLIVGAGLSTQDVLNVIAGVAPTSRVAYAASAGTSDVALVALSGWPTVSGSGLTNVAFAAGLNITLNGGTAPVLLADNATVTIAASGAGGGGGGISNVVVNGKTGVLSGSGSNIVSTVTLVAADVGAVSNTDARYLAALTNPAQFATTAQGAKADTALQPAQTNDLYPRSNPSNWITLAQVPAQTNMDLSAYYPRSNPSNWIRLVDVPAQTTQLYVAEAGVVSGAQSNLLATHTAQIATQEVFRAASTVNYSTNSGNAATVGGLTSTQIMAQATNSFAQRSWVLGFSNAPATYNAADYTIDIAMPDGTTGQLFEEQWLPVKNTSGIPITNGVAVRTESASGALSGIQLVSCTDSWDRVLGTIGLSTMTTTIAPNGDGKITTYGHVNELDTSMFVEGSNLWLSATPGQLTMTMPTAAGCHQILIGRCLRSHSNQGRIAVAVRVIPRPDDIGAVATNDTRYLAALTNAAAFDPAGTAGVVSASIAARDGASQDPTGWTQEDGASWTFATNTRTLTVTGLSGLWVNGVSNPVYSVTAQIGTNTGLWFIYAPNGTTNFTASQTSWSLQDAQLATVYNDNDGGALTNYMVADETHTAWMQWRTHRRFHMVPGTAAAYASGLTLTMSAVNSWSVSAGVMFDEDLMHSLPLTNKCWIAHRRGSFGRMQGPTASMFATNGAEVAVWDNAGTLQAVSGTGSANYFSMWVYALDLHTGPSLIAIVGQAEGTLATIRAEAPPANLANVIPGAEAVLLYQVILRGTAATYTETKDYRLAKVTSSAALSEVDPVWSAAKSGIEASIATAQATADAGNTTGALHTAQLTALEGRTNVWNAALTNAAAFDPAGTAGAVSAALTIHTNRTDNPHAVTAAQVGAVPTNRTLTLNGQTWTMDSNGVFTVTGGSADAVTNSGAIVLGSYVTNGANIDFPVTIWSNPVTTANTLISFEQTTNVVREVTGRFAVTNLVSITNTTRFTVALPANACSLDDIRIYAANANISSRRYRIRLYRAPSFRRTDLAYVATNCLLYATTSTVAQVVGSGTNVVNDASGIVWPIDMYWNDYGGGTNDWMSYTNATATVLWQCCTNNYDAPAGTLISRVEQFGSFNYFDATGGTGAYFEYDPTTGMTGSIYVAIGGFKK